MEFGGGNRMKRGHVEDLSTDRKLISKWDFKT